MPPVAAAKWVYFQYRIYYADLGGVKNVDIKLAEQRDRVLAKEQLSNKNCDIAVRRGHTDAGTFAIRADGLARGNYQFSAMVFGGATARSTSVGYTRAYANNFDDAFSRRVIRNKHLAGKRHRVTNVSFDTEGFPIFDSMFDAKIPKNLRGPSTTDTTQFCNATTQLAQALTKRQRRAFTSAQLRAIDSGASKIPGYTWHHHQDGITLQLVDEWTHAKTGHTGGRAASGGRR